jgi:hypothetical protein
MPSTKPLRTLAWNNRWMTGIVETCLIIGTVDGSTLSVVGSLPSGVTLLSDSRALQWDGTPTTASSGNITIRETLNGVTNDTTLAFNIYVAPVISSPVLTPGSGSATLQMTTSGTDGTLYYVLQTSAVSGIFPAEISKHTNQSDASYPFYGSTPVTGSGTYSFTPNTLAHGVTYYAYAVHMNAAGLLSKSYSLGSFTTT